VTTTARPDERGWASKDDERCVRDLPLTHHANQQATRSSSGFPSTCGATTPVSTDTSTLIWPTRPLVRAHRAAHALGEGRGWSHGLVTRIDQALVILLSGHTGNDKIRFSELLPAVRHRGRIAEVLDQLGLLDDDRVPAFETWLERNLDGLAPGIRRDIEDWIRTLHDGGPRTRPRDPNTVWHYLNAMRPILLDWSHRYDHLREVTHDDVLAVADALQGNKRRHTLCVLRSLFQHCKKNCTIFGNPTARIPVGRNTYGVILPLQDKEITEATSAATTPAARLALALAYVARRRPH
jgi:hypothetical protein